MTKSEPEPGEKSENDSGFQDESVSTVVGEFEKSGDGQTKEKKPNKIKLGRGKQSITFEFEDESGRNFEATVDISDICIKFKGFIDQFVGKNFSEKKIDADALLQDSERSDKTTDLSHRTGNSKDKKEEHLINCDKSLKNHSFLTTRVEKSSNDPVLNVKQKLNRSTDAIPSWEEFSRHLLSKNQKLFTLGKSEELQDVDRKPSVTLCNSIFHESKENSPPRSNRKYPNEGILPRWSSFVPSRSILQPKYKKPTKPIPETVVKSTNEQVLPSSTSVIDSNRRENSLESITKPKDEKAVADVTTKERNEAKHLDFIKNEPTSNALHEYFNSVEKPTSENAKPVSKQEPIPNSTGPKKYLESVSKLEERLPTEKITQTVSDELREDVNIITVKPVDEKLITKLAQTTSKNCKISSKEKPNQKSDSVNEASNLKKAQASSSDNSTSSSEELSIPQISSKTNNLESNVKCVNEKLQGRSQLIRESRQEQAPVKISGEQKPVAQEVKLSLKNAHGNSSQLRNLSHSHQSPLKDTTDSEKRDHCNTTSKPIEQKPIASVKGCPRTATNERSSEPLRPNLTTSSNNERTSNVLSTTPTNQENHTPRSTSSVSINQSLNQTVSSTATTRSIPIDFGTTLDTSSRYGSYRSNNYAPTFLQTYREPTLFSSVTSSYRGSDFCIPYSTDTYGYDSSRTKKFNEFVANPGSKKSITDLPGVGRVGGQRLRDLGFDTPDKVRQQYVKLGGDKKAFQTWMKNKTGLNSRYTSDCFDALDRT